MQSATGTRPRRLAVAAWAVFVLCALLWVEGIAFGWLSRSLHSSDASWSGGGFVAGLLFVLSVFAFPVVGVLIVTRRPGNRVGWLLLAIGAGWGLSNASSYSDYSILLHHHLPLAAQVAAIGGASWIIPIGLTGTFLLLLFPDGRLLPGRRWRAVAWISGATIGLGTVIDVMTPGTMASAGYPHTENPFGVGRAGGIIDSVHLLIIVLPLMMIPSAVALIVRFRRARGGARQQVKWLAAAASVVAGIYVVVEITSATIAPNAPHAPGWLLAAQDVALVSFVLIPTAIGIAILRHGLFDIDLIVRRTLVYSALVACLVAIYLGGVFVVESGVRTLTGGSGTLAITLSTLAVAAAFQPLRRRIQIVVDRRFYRGAYDAARTLEAFSAHMRGEIDLEALRGDVLAVVSDALHPAHAALWLAPTEAER
jgi:hypothetical protein